MSSQHAALIVDADVKGLESLVYGFQGSDWRITACPTAETASLLVKASGAEIVILVSRTDHEKALTLIRQLRSKESQRTLPILVLGPETLRTPLKEASDSDADLLPLPVLVRDVLTASQILVDARRAAVERPGEEPSIAFPAGTATTASLLRTMAQLDRSGQVRLERKGRQAEIAFSEGDVMVAHVATLQGMAAVQHVLVWDKATSTLTLRPVPRRGQPAANGGFVDEVDRFQRDVVYGLRGLGALASIYATHEESARKLAGEVPAEVTPVVRLCDGTRTLSDVLDESPFRVLDTVRILARLAELGIIVRLGAASAGPLSVDEQLEVFWQTARIVGPESANSSVSTATLPMVSSAASSGALPVAPFAPAHSELVAALPAEPTAPAPVAETPVATPAPVPAPAASEPTERPRRKTLEVAVVPPAASSSGSLPEAAAEPSVAGAFTTAQPSSVAPSTGAQASGTIELRPRKTQSGQRAVPQRSSVVIDAVMEDAAKAAETMTPAPNESATVRVAGEIQGGPSRMTGKSMPAARVSIQLDATLSEAHAEAPAAKAATPAPAVTPSSPPPDSRYLRNPTPIHTPATGRSQSGNFSPLERDFFEREADLYKDESGETFADLDGPAGKNGKSGKNGKNGAVKKTGRK